MSFGEVISGFFPLLLIILLLAAVMFFIRKYGGKFNKSGESPVKIETLGSRMIMPKKYLSVVSVQGKIFVLGVSEYSITLIKELNEINEPSIKEETKENFADILKKNIRIK